MSSNTSRFEFSLDSSPRSTVFDIRASAKDALADAEADLDTGAPVVPFDDWWPRALRREPLLAQTVLDLLDGKCLGTIGFIACGEGGNYCSKACLLRAENASLAEAAHRSRTDLLDAQTEIDRLGRDYLTVVDAIAPETASPEHAAQTARKAREDVEWYTAVVRAFEESQERLAAEVGDVCERLAAVTRERDLARVDLAQMTEVAQALRERLRMW